MLRHKYIDSLPITKQEKKEIVSREKEVGVHSIVFFFLDYLVGFYKDVDSKVLYSAAGYVYLAHQLRLVKRFDDVRQAEISRINESRLEELLFPFPELNSEIKNIFKSSLWSKKDKLKSVGQLILENPKFDFDDFRKGFDEIAVNHRSFPLIALTIIEWYSKHPLTDQQSKVRELHIHLIKAFGYTFEVTVLFDIDQEDFFTKAQDNLVFHLGKKILIEQEIWEDGFEKQDKRTLLKYIMASGIIETFYKHALGLYESFISCNEELDYDGKSNHRRKVGNLFVNGMKDRLNFMLKSYQG